MSYPTPCPQNCLPPPFFLLDLTDRSTIIAPMVTQSDTYQRIVDSAKDLMYASSYADVGVAAICDHARVKKGSFYHFFSSKQELTLAVLDSYYAAYKDEIINLAFSATLKPMERLARFSKLVIEFQLKIYDHTGQIYGCPFGNLATEMATQDEVIRQKIGHLFTQLQRLLRDTLQEAMDNGDIQPIDTEATARAILAYIEGSMMLAKTHNDPNILQQLLPAGLQIRIPTTD